jgi:diguanylate cyclase (GGDEF)-like protein
MYGILFVNCGFLLTGWAFIRYLYVREKSLTSEAEIVTKEAKKLKERFISLVDQISRKETKVHQILTLFEINRKLASDLEFDRLIKTFVAELRNIQTIEQVLVEESPIGIPYMMFPVTDGIRELHIHVRTDDEQLKHQLPYLISQLKVLIDRSMMYQKLQTMSVTDSLTGISNKRNFMERYRQEHGRSRKFKLPLSLLMIDIDHFKVINDTYGHLVGDEVLKAVAAALRDSVREIDFIGRFGGEEFCVFLPETGSEDACRAAERLRSSIASVEFKAYDEKLSLSVSVGVSSFPESSSDRDELIENADKALYRAKHEGRNRVCFL